MFRTFISLLSTRARQSVLVQNVANNLRANDRKDLKLLSSYNFSSLNQNINKTHSPALPLFYNAGNNFLKPVLISHDQVRTVIKYSMRDGRRTTVKTVLKRFYRLNWGAWIRTIAGRHNKAWRKSSKRKCRHRKHVFCNATQCRLLDTMVSGYWRKPKYYIKNPYEPYEWREEFPITRRKPWRPEGCDYE